MALEIPKPLDSSVLNEAFDRGMPHVLMSDSVFMQYRDFIYNKSGIYFADNKKYLLEARIAQRFQSHRLTSFEDYLSLIRSPAGASELPILYESITINETYFFRSPQQLEVMEKVILPDLIRSKMARGDTNPTITIWSAASSSGEEAHTIAIILTEKIKPIFPNVKFRIVGTDISNSVLNTARSGIYKQYAIRQVAPDILQKYFTQHDNLYHLKPTIKSMVSFHSLNLFDSSAMASMSNVDLIFCCNVLIYFDTESKKKVVQSLYRSLNKGGMLFVGYSESLHGVSQDFKLVHLQKALVYKKE